MDCHKLRILNYFQAEDQIENPRKDFPYTHVISIGGKTPPPEGLKHVNHIRLCYGDWTTRNLHLSTKEDMVPNHAHIQHALDFVMGVETPILIHCNAGISRSSATALAVIMARLGPGREQDAIDSLLSIKLGIYPNDLLVRYTDEILACGGDLVKAYEQTFHLKVLYKDSRTCQHCYKGAEDSEGGIICSEHLTDSLFPQVPVLPLTLNCSRMVHI